MSKLVVLSEGMTGQSYELKVDKTTIGRVDDNTFPIAQPSVSSHHCEILLRGSEVVVKDLNSTNGTFINGQQLLSGSEGILKPGQVLRLGQVDLRLEGSGPAPSPKKVDSTMIVGKGGVSLEQLEQGPQGGFDTVAGGFTKKTNKSNRFFIIGIAAFAVVMLVLFFVIFQMARSGK